MSLIFNATDLNFTSKFFLYFLLFPVSKLWSSLRSLPESSFIFSLHELTWSPDFKHHLHPDDSQTLIFIPASPLSRSIYMADISTEYSKGITNSACSKVSWFPLWKSFSRVWLLWPQGLYSPCSSPGQNTGVDSLSFLDFLPIPKPATSPVSLNLDK